jgi:hypothetical protein
MRLWFWKFIGGVVFVAALHVFFEIVLILRLFKLFVFFVVLDILGVAAWARTVQRNKILFWVWRWRPEWHLFLDLVLNWRIALRRTSIFIVNVSFQLRLNLIIVFIILMNWLNLAVMLTIWYFAAALEIFDLRRSFLENTIDFF